jgi:lipopolysaccharide export system permease protein
MSKLDKYVLTEFLGPFVFGLGIFFTLLVGVDLLYEVLRMTIREQIPTSVALSAIAYEMPAMLALTVPMATMFASLMCFARLSSDGELIAIRAGGASVRRIGMPVIVASGIMSLFLSFLVHTLIPACSGSSRRTLANYRGTTKALRHLVLRIPENGPLERIVYVDRLDLDGGVMEGVVIHEFREGEPLATFVAQTARWSKDAWLLENLEYTMVTRDGTRSHRVKQLKYDIGRSPEDLERIKYKPAELPTADLRRELEIVSHGRAADSGRAAQIRTEIATRWASPWSVLGMALIGVVLGIRPLRTSRGAALGISLAVILLYYIVMHTMTIVSEQGRLPAPVCAWAANAVLYAVAVTGLLSHDA